MPVKEFQWNSFTHVKQTLHWGAQMLQIIKSMWTSSLVSTSTHVASLVHSKWPCHIACSFPSKSGKSEILARLIQNVLWDTVGSPNGHPKSVSLSCAMFVSSDTAELSNDCQIALNCTFPRIALFFIMHHIFSLISLCIQVLHSKFHLDASFSLTWLNAVNWHGLTDNWALFSLC